jgi:acetylornithine deacetylase/succinyl-diaminopimelate desuccinylase-like protein
MSALLPLNVDDLEWGRLRYEMVSMLRSYVQIDTTNPPGNEIAAARFLARLLNAEGIPHHMYQSEQDRVNLVARLDPKHTEEPIEPPLLLLHHMDVVPADAPSWHFPPFSAALEDGYIWGRGTLDAKGLGVMQLMSLVLLRRCNVQLRRPVILLAVADEEQGGDLGAAWMVQNHWPEVQCEYLWDEGGFGTVGIMSALPVFAVAVAEKRWMRVKLTAWGQAGHAAMPPATGTTSIDRLVQALDKLQHWQAPIELNEVNREFFRRIARLQGFPTSLLMHNLHLPLVQPLVRGKLVQRPAVNAMVRNTISLTRVQAGYIENMIPAKAEAVLDVRLLPDSDPEVVHQWIQRVIDDPAVEVEVTGYAAPSRQSPFKSAMFEAIEAATQRQRPGSITVPLQTPGSTDSRHFRAKGVKAYGLVPGVITQEELETVHGVDERISVDNLLLGTQVVLDVVLQLCQDTSFTTR